MIDPLIGKREQLLLATQLCRLVLKVCDLLSPKQYAFLRGWLTDTDLPSGQVNNVIVAGDDEDEY